MVVFTCNHCGDSLQKPRVEKHYSFVCRTIKSLTCVDCLKDFRGEEYAVHNKCISEEERYSAKGAIPGGLVKKGEVKQESWIEMIQSILEKEQNMQPSARNLFNMMSNYSNIPRKKPKFMNFIKSCLGGRVHQNDMDTVWNIIEKYKAEQQAKNKGEEKLDKFQSVENGTTENKKRKIDDSEELENNLKKKKNKSLETNGERTESEIDNKEAPAKKSKKNKDAENVPQDSNISQESNTFNLESAILDLLQKKKTMTYSKFEKKICKTYTKQTANESTEKFLKKLKKKAKKINNIEIKDDTIVLNN